MIGPIFEGFANKVTGVDFYKVDIDDAADIASKLSIRSVSDQHFRFTFMFEADVLVSSGTYFHGFPKRHQGR